VRRDEELVHQALLYGDEDTFLGTAVPFLHDGLEDGGAVLAVVAEPNIMALKGTMGRDASPVMFVASEGFYVHPARTIAQYHQIVQKTLPKRVWALAEPVWRGRTVEERRDWQRYESAINITFETSGAQVICAYDTRVITDDVLESTGVTHPVLLEGQGAHKSRGYVEPTLFSVNGDRDPLPPPSVVPDVLRLGDSLSELRVLRTFLSERAAHHKMPAKVISKFLVAVDEVASNALRHGAPPMEVRVWAEDGMLYGEVMDFGHWRPDAMIGHVPQDAGLGSFGLWGVRLLADTMQLRTGWSGTVVRLGIGLAAE
jgi:anti-sigma regulatory factor (Ser/Thr protein kinase)